MSGDLESCSRDGVALSGFSAGLDLLAVASTDTLRVQVDLRAGNRHRTCWVDRQVKVGNRITLRNSEDPGLWWEVLRVSTPVGAGSINRGWHNDI